MGKTLFAKDLEQLNSVAEQILKTIGAERFGPPGSTKKGLRVFEEYIEQLGYE